MAEDKEVDNQQLNEIMSLQASMIKAGFIPKDIAYDYVYAATKKKLFCILYS